LHISIGHILQHLTPQEIAHFSGKLEYSVFNEETVMFIFENFGTDLPPRWLAIANRCIENAKSYSDVNRVREHQSKYIHTLMDPFSDTALPPLFELFDA
jgi:hypothetical protein